MSYFCLQFFNQYCFWINTYSFLPSSLSTTSTSMTPFFVCCLVFISTLLFSFVEPVLLPPTSMYLHPLFPLTKMTKMTSHHPSDLWLNATSLENCSLPAHTWSPPHHHHHMCSSAFRRCFLCPLRHLIHFQHIIKCGYLFTGYLYQQRQSLQRRDSYHLWLPKMLQHALRGVPA